MRKRDLQEVKEQVRARADIVDIVSGYTRLKQSGKYFVGLCPFHADKTPSFNVSPSFQSYRCWACGEKGDVFTFLEKKENLTFIEALELLAQRVGVPFELSGLSRERMSEREEMHALNSLAVGYYRDRLSRSEDARSYLSNRAILKETQDRFDIGFAAPDWEGLAAYLQRRGANLALAAKVGLLRERKETQGYIDYYRNRVMFPIHDRTGNVAGFGGRSLGDEQPKYLNSPQSEVFNKSALLYGLYFARQRLGANVPPVFVEGYTDVVTTHQAGFTQCVATLGTAMTETHARMLVNYNRKVVLCYDSDSAGINATLKGAAIWEELGVEGAELLVARLPAGEDPDSLLKRGDVAAFQRALDDATPRVDFEMELALQRNNHTTNSGRDRALSEIIPILSTVHGDTNLDRYIEKVARFHPMYALNPARAMESIRSDVQAYRARSRSRNSGRRLGHAAVEEQNGTPLREQAPPPTYQPDNRQGFNPNSKGWVQARSPQDGGRRFWRFEERRPAGDPTPPSLRPPMLSAAEKAEYTLLRALFTAEWRNFILTRMELSHFETDQARRLADIILQTLPNEEGEIDPLDVLRRIEAPDEEETDVDITTDSSGGESLEFEQLQSINGNHSSRMSDYLRDVVEESATVLSNEPLNEATIVGCIRRLQEHRKARAIKDVIRELERDDLTVQQRTDFLHSLMELKRAHHGSAPGM